MNKRLVLTAPKTLEINEEPIPEPPANGMVVKIHYAGICHSDVHFWEDELRIDDNTVVPLTSFPAVLGHEIAGEVYSIGAGGFADNPSLQKGDKVLVFPWAGCAECEVCKAGDNNWCAQLRHRNNMGCGRDGGFQAYLKVNSTDCVQKLPSDTDMRVACMLTCSALTTYNGVSKIISEVTDGIKYRGFGRVLLLGSGGLGLWATQWAQTILPQPTKVYMADVVEGKLKDALDLGAAGVILLSRDGDTAEMAKLAKKNAGGEFDAAVDLVGAAKTAEILNKALRNGGRQVEIGLAGGSFTVPLAPTILSAKSFDTCLTGNPAQMVEVTNQWLEGKVKCQPLTTFKPEEVNNVMELIVEGKLNGRGIIDFIN